MNVPCTTVAVRVLSSEPRGVDQAKARPNFTQTTSSDTINAPRSMPAPSLAMALSAATVQASSYVIIYGRIVSIEMFQVWTK